MKSCFYQFMHLKSNCFFTLSAHSFQHIHPLISIFFFSVLLTALYKSPNYLNTNQMAQRWFQSCLYCGVISILYASCPCLAGTLHQVSNENKVRGLWSVIIFIWVTVGGCSTFVSPIRDSSLSSSGGNEHQALVICWGWHL